MRISSLIAAAALAILPVTAAPTTVTKLATDGINWNWTVVEWEAGCARSGCYYSFDIWSDPYETYPDAPGFYAHCNGDGEGGAFKQCSIIDEGPVGRQVSAHLRQRTEAEPYGAHIAVSYQHNDASGSAYWNWTAYGVSTYNQFVSPPLRFNLTPSEVFAIA